MIRISTRTGPEGRITLYVEGRLRAANVETLANAWRAAMPRAAGARPLVLDLSGVSFVDATGARHIQEAREAGVELSGCTGLIAELLRAHVT